MRWIEAHDLAQWGGTRDGQAKLPELVSRLILAVYGPAAALGFPSDDSIQHAGWDGVCDAPSDSTYIPTGKSVWEISAQRAKIGAKAQDDYAKRTANPLGANPSQTCYIFLHAATLVLLDQAGWHVSKKLPVPDNITLLSLPPKSPELNPVENIWQFMRDNWLSNRVFNSYDGILGHCCCAWNKLIDMPWKIMSIGVREWAHRS